MASFGNDRGFGKGFGQVTTKHLGLAFWKFSSFGDFVVLVCFFLCWGEVWGGSFLHSAILLFCSFFSFDVMFVLPSLKLTFFDFSPLKMERLPQKGPKRKLSFPTTIFQERFVSFSLGRVPTNLPSFTRRINHPCNVGKYTSPIDSMSFFWISNQDFRDFHRCLFSYTPWKNVGRLDFQGRFIGSTTRITTFLGSGIPINLHLPCSIPGVGDPHHL